MRVDRQMDEAAMRGRIAEILKELIRRGQFVRLEDGSVGLGPKLIEGADPALDKCVGLERNSVISSKNG